MSDCIHSAIAPNMNRCINCSAWLGDGPDPKVDLSLFRPAVVSKLLVQQRHLRQAEAKNSDTGRYFAQKGIAECEHLLSVIDGNAKVTTWQPIDSAPRDNKRSLYLARFNEAGELVEVDWDGVWEHWSEGPEMPHIQGWDWASTNGIHEPTHWAYQDEPIPTVLPPTFQQGVAKWMEECFVASLYSNMTERGDRFLEEVLEMLQAHGYPFERISTLADYVYKRPVGDPEQEVGGVMITLAGFCYIAGHDMQALGDRELERINQPEVKAKIQAKQAAKAKIHFDTPLPGNAHEQ